MAKKMLLDETRALRREQRDARIARKRERREARALKRQHRTVGLEELALERIDVRPTQPQFEEPVPAAETVVPEPSRPPTTRAAELSGAPQPVVLPVEEAEAPAAKAANALPREARTLARRERDIAEFLERRTEKLSLARQEANERIARLGEEETVHDALMALAHPEASPWQQHRERLCEAIATRRIPEIGAVARRACRGAAADAARTSRRAPDADRALAVAIAYAIIARAPWATIRGQRAERSDPTRQARRPFWR
jgi:hypothetical protein